MGTSLNVVCEEGLEVSPLPKVFVVDDDPVVLSSIEALLTAHSYDVTCFASAEEFIAEHHPNQDDCIVIDLTTPGISGSDLMRHLQDTRSLLSVAIILGLIESAAPHEHEKPPVPILARPYEVWILLTMIKDAIAQSQKRDRALVHILSSQDDWLHHYGTNVPAKDKILKLSPRQRQVMSFLLAGDSLKEVAQKLGLSEHTVGDHVKQIYKHFSVSSRAELLAHFIPGGQT
jgi:FixJ family two-component response regulator